jgi:molecular chaperone GrpE
MADDTSKMGEGAEVALDLDGQTEDLEAAMRDAVAAVEGVTEGKASGRQAAGVGDVRDAGNAGNIGNVGDGDGDEEEVGKLRQEIADLRDRSMRTLADFDNFRKRAERERQDLRRYAALEPLSEFLGIMDNLELALSATGSLEDLKRGVEMIHRQMQDLLRRSGAREIEAAGQPFDPAIHEAVSREESPGVQKPTVAGEMRRGYFLHDRLLRPAMVRVAVPVESKPSAGDA